MATYMFYLHMDHTFSNGYHHTVDICSIREYKLYTTDILTGDDAIGAGMFAVSLPSATQP